MPPIVPKPRPVPAALPDASSTEPAPYLEIHTPAEMAAHMGAEFGGRLPTFFERLFQDIGQRVVPPGGVSLATQRDAFQWFAGVTAHFAPAIDDLWERATDTERDLYRAEADDFAAHHSIPRLGLDLLYRLRTEAPDSPERSSYEQALLGVLPPFDDGKVN